MSVQILKTGIVDASGGIRPNLVIGTHRPEFKTGGAVGARALKILGANSGGDGTFTITVDNNLPVGRYSYNVIENTTGNRDYQQDEIPYISGRKYTGSWWARGSGTCLYRVWNCTQGTEPMTQRFTLSPEWKFYSHTFTATSEMETNNCTFHIGVTGASTINICGMKLEEGEYPTAWCPNKEDTYYVGATSGFNESSLIASITKVCVNAPNFIEI